MHTAAPQRTPREPWLTVRQELSANRRLVLMLCSFLMPIALWCLLAYVPAFHAEYKFTLTTEPIEGMAAYTPGSRIRKDFFSQHTDLVREANRQIIAQREAGETYTASRNNKKRIRDLRPIALSRGWLDGVDMTDIDAIDAALYDTHRKIAQGLLPDAAAALTEENLAIIRENWAIMDRGGPYDSSAFTRVPMRSLIPQGVSASPAFLPAPHECVIAAWSDFTTKPPNNLPWMHQRLFSSLKVVFGAFVLACAIGIPLGILCGTYDFFAKLAEPFTDFFRYMPAPTFGLLLMAALGTAGAPKIALVFIGTFPHMVLMLGNTTRLLDRSLIEAAQTLGAKDKLLVARVIIPGILPKLYNDLRVLLGWAWTWLVIAELIGEKSGLTDFIVTQGGRYNFDRVFPVIMLIGIIGFLTDQTLQVLARYLFPWEYTQARQGFFALWRETLTRRRRAGKVTVDDRPMPAITPQEGAAGVSSA